MSFNCFKCKNEFDLEERAPKVLICCRTICLECLSHFRIPGDSYRIHCECNCIHVNSSHEIFQCDIATNFLKEELNAIGMTQDQFLDAELIKSRFSLTATCMQTDDCFTSLGIEINERVENLIEAIHTRQSQLHAELDFFEDQAYKDFTDVKSLHCQQVVNLERNLNEQITSNL